MDSSKYPKGLLGTVIRIMIADRKILLQKSDINNNLEIDKITNTIKNLFISNEDSDSEEEDDLQGLSYLKEMLINSYKRKSHLLCCTDDIPPNHWDLINIIIKDDNNLEIDT